MRIPYCTCVSVTLPSFYILNAVGLSLLRIYKKPENKCVVDEKVKKRMRRDLLLLLLLVHFNELPRQRIKGTLTGLLFIYVPESTIGR